MRRHFACFAFVVGLCGAHMRRNIAGFALAALIGLAGAALCGQSAAQSGGPVTNESVIRMVRAGVPEAAVVASIQRSTPNFDLSTNGLAMLKGAGVGEVIARAMLQAQWTATLGTSQPAGTPQPSGTASPTPAGRGPSLGQTPQQKSPQINAVLAKIHSAKGKLSPIVSNPAAGQSNTATVATLRQQKQVALNESGGQGGPAGMVPPTSTNSRLSTMQGPAIAAVPAPQSSGSNRAAIAAPTSVALSCGAFSAPMILTVSGEQGGATFTQDPNFNPFTIKGCNFGSSRGQAQLNGANGRKLAGLNVDTWTDALITAEVDPTLIDALDQDNITLVIFPANGPQAQKSGFHFYAKRIEMLLTSIPKSEASLGPINDDSGNPVTAQFSSPYSLSGGNMSGGVDRYNVVRFPGGTDSFDFSKLKPGFVLEKFQVDTLSQVDINMSSACTGFGPTTSTAYTDGNWAWQMTGNTIQVTWMEAHCHDAFNGDWSGANYGLNVWLVGPVISSATSPWQAGVQ